MTSNGVISFRELNYTETLERPPSIPLIATLWNLSGNQQNNTLYIRLTDDESTLDLVREILREDTTELSDFQPSLVVVITWISKIQVAR